jgi:hypothetical protein
MKVDRSPPSAVPHLRVSWSQAPAGLYVERAMGCGRGRRPTTVTITRGEDVAQQWDAYLRQFGAEAYVLARYIYPSTTMPTSEDPTDRPLSAAQLLVAHTGVRGIRMERRPSRTPS